MESREQMLARAKEIIDRVEKERADYKGSCSGCKHRYKVFVGSPRCNHPIVIAGSQLENQGYHQERTVECDYQRQGGRGVYGEVFCGPNGYLFEPKQFSLLIGLKRFFKKSPV